MRQPIKIEDLRKSACSHLNPHLFGDLTDKVLTKKKTKYGSVKTDVDGIAFDSKKEAKYYKTLLLLKKAGKIGLMELQVPYELNEGGTHSLKYVADFVYVDMETGVKKIIDVKGYKTRDYLRKKRLMKKVFNIEIIEI